MARAICMSFLLAAAVCAVGPRGLAQETRNLQFEVGTVKANESGAPISMVPGFRNGRFAAQNVSLRTLLAYAYGVSELQISGPDWLASKRYDVAATVPGEAGQPQVALMLEKFITERFKLVTHPSAREMDVFALIVEEKGPKSRHLEPGETFKPTIPRGASVVLLSGDMKRWSEVLSGIVGRPVIDQTGLSGSYTVMLAYDNGTQGDTPGVFTATKEQLGLRLAPQKMPLTVFVVDKAEMVPTEN